MTIEKLSETKVFDGWQSQYNHQSTTLNCTMRFAIFLPPRASENNKVPVLYWLSGLTCTDENFMQKSGMQKFATEYGIAVVAPDTSPRGDDVADDENYDLGKGAGFYLNATEPPWNKHFQMYDYIVSELPALIEANFPVDDRRAISGHSMGGHGALTIAMKNPSRYVSMSAFSPICNPTISPWGINAFSHYLGENKALWKQYDACELMRTSSETVPAKIDQGLADNFLAEQLKLDNLVAIASDKHYPVEIQQHEGYDHSYYFISTFIGSHLAFHAKHLFSQ